MLHRVGLVKTIFWGCWLLLPILAWGNQTVSNRTDPDGMRQDINGNIRYAVAQINAGVGGETIFFSLSNSITVLAPLIINQPNTTIDGGVPHSIIVGGTGMGTNDIFQIRANGCVIKNLAIVSGNTGVAIYSSNNQVLSCALGTDWVNSPGRGLQFAVGVATDPANFLYGANNRIGSPAMIDPYYINNYIRLGNVIAANNAAFAGVLANQVPGLIVQSNLIGLASDGTTALGNGDGIELINGCTGALIGGNAIPGNTITASFGEGNIIGANNKRGIYLSGAFGTSVCGNVLGLSLDQTLSKPNTSSGVTVVDSPGTKIGLPQAGKGNVICSSLYGVWVSGSSGGSALQNNFIGVNGAGLSFGNTSADIETFNVPVLIGGRREAAYHESNVISGSANYGIYLNGSSNGNTVSGNFIGTDPTGTQARPNATGVYVQASSGNLIGGTNNGAGQYGNLISGNTSRGVYLVASSKGNSLAGNLVGVDATGNNALPNATGVETTASGPNSLGVPGADAVNVISGNTVSNLRVGTGSQALVANNYLGLNSAGTGSVGSATTNLLNLDGALSCKVGGSAAEKNLFCGPATYGALLQNSAAGNSLTGNWFGVSASGAPLSGAGTNIRLATSAHDNLLGSAALLLGNLITGGGTGLYADANCTRNAIFSNTICGWSTGGITLNNSNNFQAKPLISNYAGGALIGTAAPGDFVQLFLAESKSGQGGSLQVLGNAPTNGSGSWTFPLAGYDGQYVTAQGTSANAYSSEFAENFQIPVAGTPTFTPSATPTMTPTPSPSPTASPTPTGSLTFTTTPSATSTPSVTASGTPTQTRTASATLTVTPSHSATLTASATPSLSGTMTATRTASATATPSLTVSATATNSPSQTVTATPSPTAPPTTPTATLSSTASGAATADLKGKFALSFPNPAKDHVRFILHPDQSGTLKIEIYNLAGELVAAFSTPLAPGEQTVSWDCTGIAPGIYLANLIAEGKSVGKLKIAIVR